MKTLAKRILQPLLGMERYLRWHARYKIRTLKGDKKENHFFHFLSLLPAEGTLLDIGANIGIMTAHLSKARPNCTIHSFEPVPLNYKVLEHIVQRNGLSNVQLHNHALGADEKEMEIVVPIESKVYLPGLSHIVHDSIKEFNEGERTFAQVKRLDDLAPVLGKVTGMKLDVENFEYFVLNGAQQLLSQQRPIVYTELWDNENRSLTLNLLHEIGYSVNVVVNNGLVEYDPQEHSHQNFIALPN